MVYDGPGRVAHTSLDSDPQGAIETDTTYDLDGRLFTVTNPYRSGDSSHGSTTYTYDGLSRKQTVETLPDAATSSWKWTGNLLDIFDQSKNHEQQTHDALGRLTSVKEPDVTNTPSIPTIYVYDAQDQLKTVTQPANGSNGARVVRTFSYDLLSRLTSAVNGETGATTYNYLLSNGSPCSGETSNVCIRADARGIIKRRSKPAEHIPACRTADTPFRDTTRRRSAQRFMRLID